MGSIFPPEVSTPVLKRIAELALCDEVFYKNPADPMDVYGGAALIFWKYGQSIQVRMHSLDPKNTLPEAIKNAKAWFAKVEEEMLG